MTPSKLLIALTCLLAGCSTGYENNGDAVYYKYWNEGFGSQKDRLEADPKTFVVLKNKKYAKDKEHVFFEAAAKEADTLTLILTKANKGKYFVILTTSHVQKNQCQFHFSL
jgi:hypothetical protein